MKKQNIIKKNFGVLTIVTLIFLLLFFYFINSIFIMIDAGHTGVLFKRFGNKGVVLDKVYSEGINIIWPWDRLISYDVKIQEFKEAVSVLSKNGLTIDVIVSIRYQLVRSRTPWLHQNVGKEYRRKIIQPSIISSVREVVGEYSPIELYTKVRKIMQDQIMVELLEETRRIPIMYSNVIIETIKLPVLINDAIESKLKREQEFLEYEFKILMENQEVKRKIIEASGIKKYNSIVNESLTEKILTLKGIQATIDLAKSQNSKVVVIGSGEKGLPIILNTETQSKNEFLDSNLEIENDSQTKADGKNLALGSQIEKDDNK